MANDNSFETIKLYERIRNVLEIRCTIGIIGTTGWVRRTIRELFRIFLKLYIVCTYEKG